MTAIPEDSSRVSITVELIKYRRKYRNNIYKISLTSNISSPTYPDPLDPKLSSSSKKNLELPRDPAHPSPASTQTNPE